MHEFFRSIWFFLIIATIIFAILFMIGLNNQIYCKTCLEGTICNCPNPLETMPYRPIILTSLIGAGIIFGLVNGINLFLVKLKKK